MEPALHLYFGIVYSAWFVDLLSLLPVGVTLSLIPSCAVAVCMRHAKEAIFKFIATSIVMNVLDFKTSLCSSPISTRAGIQGGRELWSCGTPTRNNACAKLSQISAGPYYLATVPPVFTATQAP